MQWLSVSLDGLYLTDRIELEVEQTPAGRTTHELWLGHPAGTQTLYKRFTAVYTEQGQTLAVDFEPPVRINEVMILTLSGPSWVAWREVRVFGVKAGKAEEAVEAPRWKLNKISGGLDKPVHVTHAGDGSGRTFVVEHPGRIRIIKDGVLSDIPFLDITDRVRCCGEEGLVGLAFSPTYTSSQQFYVGYSNAQGATTISRFATTSDPDIADPASEEVLLTVSQPRDNHNGGHLAFGPRDGYLYIGSGDGGEAGIVVTTGQERDSLLGKILRIDVESGVKPYGIPPVIPLLKVPVIAAKSGRLACAIPGASHSTARPATSMSPMSAIRGTKRSTTIPYPAQGAEIMDGLRWRAISAHLSFPRAAERTA